MAELSLARILLPIDFSAQSAGAARQAKALAARFHSEVHVLHVLDLRAYGLLGLGIEESAAGEPAQKTAAERELDAFRAAELAGVRSQGALLSGDPGREIAHYAQRNDIDLIVMPTHGFGPFRRLMLGSVTSKILHDCDCPVWTGAHIREAPAAPDKFDEIVCALDIEEHSRKPLEWAWQFGQKYDAKLTIVHAIPSLPEERHGFFGNWPEYMVNRAKEQMQALQTSAGTKAAVEIRSGEIAAVTAAVAREKNAALCVIGRGAAAGFAGRLRTYSYAIIRESPCPVVSV
jgi:nucleotide-binding universal stress UspA family protein